MVLSPFAASQCEPALSPVPWPLQQIKVTLNDEDMDTFVFAVGNRKAMARLQKEMQDLVRIP